MKVYLIVILVFLGGCFDYCKLWEFSIATPSEWDTKQDERFWNFITADAELSKDQAVTITKISERLGLIVWLVAAISLMLLGVVASWIKKRLKI